MTSQNSLKNDGNNNCIACFEKIKNGARICPHCQSPQSTQRLRHFTTSLKFIGAIVTVVSLVLGMASLNGLYRNWKETRQAVTEMVSAAQHGVDIDTAERQPVIDIVFEEALAGPVRPGIGNVQADLAVADSRKDLRDSVICGKVDSGGDGFDARFTNLACTLDRLLRVAGDSRIHHIVVLAQPADQSQGISME